MKTKVNHNKIVGGAELKTGDLVAFPNTPNYPFLLLERSPDSLPEESMFKYVDLQDGTVVTWSGSFKNAVLFDGVVELSND